MDCLITIRQNLDEKQFTQLAYIQNRHMYVISVYFRCTNKFKSIKYKEYEDAVKFYEIIK